MPDLYLLIDGKQEGPYTEDQVRQSLSEGLIPPDLPAWHEALADWTPLSKMLEEPTKVLTGDVDYAEHSEGPHPIVQPPPFPPHLTNPKKEVFERLRAATVFVAQGFKQIVLGMAQILLGVIDLIVVGSKGRITFRLASIGVAICLALTIFFIFRSNHSIGSEGGSSDVTWTSDSPESMLSYAVDRMKQEGVGIGTVTSASQGVVVQGDDSNPFIGVIKFNVHADASSFGISSSFTGASDTKCEAIFSYDRAEHKWTRMKLTVNGSPIDGDDDPVLIAISNYLPEPYQIVMRSH